jgi:hypothetical protein
MAKMTHEQMIALMATHDAAEARGDIEATMATVSANPCWELHPLGYVISTRAAVAEFYRRVLPSVKDIVSALKKKNLWFNDDGYAVEFELAMVDQSAAPFVSRIITAFEFENGLLKAERAFLGTKHAKIMQEALRPDFLRVPGVTLAR